MHAPWACSREYLLVLLRRHGGSPDGSLHTCAASVQGNCPPPDAEFLAKLEGELPPLQEGQCIILANNALLPITKGVVWVDNFVFMYKTSTVEAGGSSSAPALLHVHSGTAFISRMVIQGNGANQVAAFWVFPTSRILMHGALRIPRRWLLSWLCINAPAACMQTARFPPCMWIRRRARRQHQCL
jgi:hypothetical protein